MCDLKLCKDCKFCHRSWFDKLVGWHEFAECNHPENIKIDPVSGKQSPRWRYCAINRLTAHASYECGKEGKFFEPKE